MLKGISPLLSPDLLAVLYEMGHGDEIVLADAHFPAASMNQRVIRADGLHIHALLDAILPLFELDQYDEHPLIMMEPVAGDRIDQVLISDYQFEIEKHLSRVPAILNLDRFEFYRRAKEAFAIVATGETAKYGNIILKKGVTPV